MEKRILIIADMEGCSLIRSKKQVFSNSLKPVEFGRKAMEHDINAVLEGLKRAGITEVYIVDWHDMCDNIRRKNLKVEDLKLKIFRNGILDVLGKSHDIDAAIFIGFHSRPGKKAILSHCYSFSVKDLLINNKKSGETGLNIYSLYYCKIPVILVSGSYDAVKEAKNMNKDIQGVATKRGFKVYPRKEIREQLIGKTIKAMSNPAKPKKLKNPKIELCFKDGSNYSIEGKNIVEKQRKIEEIVEDYLKKRKIAGSNIHILKDNEIR